MIGSTFGRLTVDAKAAAPRYWRCRCACGTTRDVRGDHLRAGKTTSCGCAAREALGVRNTEAIRHGHAAGFVRSPTYRSWQSMRTRCLNPKSDGYPEYGARGITVCARWNSFEAFLLDMGERPAGTTLDRRDNSKGYEPGNCRWATTSEQENNKRASVFIEHNGLRLTVAEWSAKTGIGYQTLRKRVEAGWSAAQIVGEPAHRR